AYRGYGAPFAARRPDRRLQAGHELRQRPDGHAGGAFRQVVALLVVGGRAGDVQMRPARLVDEFADDERARDGAGRTAAGVLDVRDVALVLLLVLRIRGQAAVALAGLGARGQDGFGQRVVGGYEAAV